MWCHEHYTNLSSGRALMVVGDHQRFLDEHDDARLIVALPLRRFGREG
jgi:hypothetical protein